MFGRNRTHFYGRYLRSFSTPTASAIYAYRPDGNTFQFVKEADNWTGKDEAILRKEMASGIQVGWVLDAGPLGTEHYNMEGQLLYLESQGGRRQTLTLNTNGDIEKITDDKGRELKFYFSSAGRAIKASLPEGGSIEFSYTNRGDLSTVKYQDGTVVTYLYDQAAHSAAPAFGAMTEQFDEAGQRFQTTTYEYSGRATSTSLAGDVGTSSATYVGSVAGLYNHSARITLPDGAIRDVAFSLINGEVLANSSTEGCVGCASSVESYTFDASGRFDVVTKNGVSKNFDYDENGLLLRVEEASNSPLNKRTVETVWDPEKRVPIERRIKDALGQLVREESWQTNYRGQVLVQRITGQVVSEARETSATYCEATDVAADSCPSVGLITSSDGLRNDVDDSFLYSYRHEDAPSCAGSPSTCPYRKSDLWKVTNAKGQVTETLKYDGAGRVLSVKDPNGVITDYEYHPRGWLTASKVRGPDNAVETDDAITRVAYWPTGLVKQVTQPDGAFTLYTYDAAHRLTDISDNAGNTIHYVLDNAGNRIAEETKDAGGALKRTLSRIYNQLGQLATQADAQAHPTDFTYDANGNANTVTDALGRVTDHDHDPLNRLARTLQDVGGIAAETRFQYDALDNLTKVTDPKGLDTIYTYNGLGDLTQLQSPDTGTTSYTYDSAGNRASQTDARGVTTTYAHDALNRLTAVNYPDTALNVSYTYDTVPTACEAGETFSVGRLSGMDDASGSTRYCYNRFGHLVRKVQTTNGVSFVVRYAYTLGGNLQAMVYPDGTTVDYGRNAQGQVTEVGVTRSGQPRQVLLHQATYHPFGPVAGWTDGSGRSLSRTLDQDYRPLTIEDPNTGGLSLGFGYDAVGNLTTLGTAQGVANPAIRFGYDALGRLTRTEDGLTQAAIDVYAYDATGNRTAHTTAAGTAAYSYPSTSHRLTDVAGVPRNYDAVGNTTAIGANRGFAYNDANRMSLVQQSGVTTRQYAYNGRGEQVRRYLGATNTYTVYDEAGHWLGDYDDSGAPLQQALWMDDLPVGLLANGNQLHYLQPDHLGSPRVVIEAARNVPVWTWDLKGEAFGSTAPQQDPDGDGIPFVLDMRFPGQRYDVASNLYYNYFRDYEPGSGRYIQSDSIGLSGGISTFAYTGRSPLLFVDPQGLQACRTTYGVFFNVISCEPVGMASTGAAAGSNRGLYNPAEQSIMAKYCKGDDKCEELKLNVNKFIDIAEGQIDRMRRDRFIHNLYELARHEPNFAATGTHTTWEGHQSTTRELLELIRNMINLGHKLGCNMGAEYDRYVALQLPGIPDP